jgi:hypothetical protein
MQVTFPMPRLAMVSSAFTEEFEEMKSLPGAAAVKWLLPTHGEFQGLSGLEVIFQVGEREIEEAFETRNTSIKISAGHSA